MFNLQCAVCSEKKEIACCEGNGKYHDSPRCGLWPSENLDFKREHLSHTGDVNNRSGDARQLFLRPSHFF